MKYPDGFDMETIRDSEHFAHYSKSKIDRFIKFHNENPQVFVALESLTSEIINTGRKKYSFKTIYTVLRWRNDLRTQGDKFKLNDLYQALYARAMICKYPNLKGFFSMRKRENQYEV